MGFDIKNFIVGQKVYILRKQYHEETTVTETVLKVGRKYVTVSGVGRNEVRFEIDEDFPFGLVENTEYGDKDFLFFSVEDLHEYLNWRHTLSVVRHFAFKTGFLQRLSLSELRSITAIFDRNMSEEEKLERRKLT